MNSYMSATRLRNNDRTRILDEVSSMNEDRIDLFMLEAEEAELRNRIDRLRQKAGEL